MVNLKFCAGFDTLHPPPSLRSQGDGVVNGLVSIPMVTKTSVSNQKFRSCLSLSCIWHYMGPCGSD